MEKGDLITVKRHYYNLSGLGGIIPQFIENKLPFLMSIFFKHRIELKKGSKMLIDYTYIEEISKERAFWLIPLNKKGPKYGFDAKLSKKHFFLSKNEERIEKLKKLNGLVK